MSVYSKEPPRCSQRGPVSPSMRWPLAAGPGGSTLVTRRSKKLPQPEMLVSSFHTTPTGASTISVGQARYVGVVMGSASFGGGRSNENRACGGRARWTLAWNGNERERVHQWNGLPMEPLGSERHRWANPRG